jgi:acetyl esterase/lipase
VQLAVQIAVSLAVQLGLSKVVALLDSKVPELEGLYDPGRVALHGYGAGGYLSSLTALHLAEISRNVSVMVAHAPMVMPFGGTPSMLDYGSVSCYSSDMFRWSWTMYLRGDAGRIAASHHVNLLLAPPELLQKLPPAYVSLHTYDPLHDEGKMFVDALQAAGKLLDFDDFPGTHCITGMSGTHLSAVLEKSAEIMSRYFSPLNPPLRKKRRYKFFGLKFEL